MKEEKKNKLTFIYLFGGGILKEDFWIRHVKMILLVCFLFVIFIGNRYSYIKQMGRIDKLEKELIVLKRTSFAIKNNLIDYGRRTKVLERVNEQGLSIELPDRPPFILDK